MISDVVKSAVAAITVDVCGFGGCSLIENDDLILMEKIQSSNSWLNSKHMDSIVTDNFKFWYHY